MLYDELRQLAHAYLARLSAGQTLQTTALVHEAFLRLVGKGDPGWNGRHHFFGAAARAMRNILVEQARRKASLKHGGAAQRVSVDLADLPIESPVEDLVALDEALVALEKEDPRKAEIVMLRYFAGLTREATAAVLGVSAKTSDREWRYILARLHRDMSGAQIRA